MNKLYAVIIENNSDNSSTLERTLSKSCPEIIVSGHAKTVSEASEIIAKDEFDIIFLDIDSGREEAFQFLEDTLPRLDDKALVVLSSRKEHAVEAFKYVAVDFLLKPVKPDAVIHAVDKVRKHIDLKLSYIQPKKVLQRYPIKIIAIPSLTDIRIIQVNDIIYLESEGRYTVFHTAKGEKLVSSRNLGTYEKVLINSSFLRVHHSYLVNMNFALNIQKKDGFYIEVPNKKYLSISKRRMDALYEFLSIK